MASQNQNDEIDLIELLAKIIFIVRKNTLLLLVCFVTGTLLGFVYFQQVPKKYKSSMMVTSEVLTEDYAKILSETIKKLLNEGNSASIAQLLNISAEEASKINSLSIKMPDKVEIFFEQEKQTFQTLKTFLTIDVECTDNAIWPNIQKGILYYLQNNEFVKLRVEQRKKYFGEMIKKIDQQLQDLDELKSKIANGQQARDTKENPVIVELGLLYTSIIDLNKDKFEFSNLLETATGVQVVQGFTVFAKPSSPKLSISLAAGASYGVLFVMLILGVKAIRRMVRFSKETLANT
jgi:hypothetical protein